MVRYLPHKKSIMQLVIIISITINGGVCTLGECIILGFLKDYHPKIVASWGAGTGLSALAASILIYSQKESNNYNKVDDLDNFSIDFFIAIPF